MFTEPLFIAAIIVFLFMLTITILLLIRIKGIGIALNESRAHHSKLEKLSQSILEITQAVVGTENPEDLYNMILEKAIDSIDNANVGSVLVKGQDGLFHCAAQRGFDDEKINNFSLPIEETIIWKHTKGNITESEIVNDVMSLDEIEIKPLTVNPEEWSIKSSIAVPLFSENNLDGLLHIDSKELNAFTAEDKQIMEHIRGNIEIALQKFMLYQRMVTMSRHDSLTDAFNRNYFMDQFDNTLNKAERYKQKFSLVIFDINDLKKINDSKGHIAGDDVLKTFSATTLKLIRKTDTFARWGGDEFMALFYEMSEEEIVEKVEIIRESLKDREDIKFSYGHAFYPDEGEDFDSLLRIADNRMYINKKQMKKGE